MGVAFFSTKRRQFYQIILWDRFDWLASLAPGCESSDDHKRAKPLLPQ